MPRMVTLDDGHVELLHRAVAVSRQAEAAAAGGDSTACMLAARQLSGLTATLETMTARLSLIAEAYEQGWADRGYADAAPARRRLTAVRA